MNKEGGRDIFPPSLSAKNSSLWYKLLFFVHITEHCIGKKACRKIICCVIIGSTQGGRIFEFKGGTI